MIAISLGALFLLLLLLLSTTVLCFCYQRRNLKHTLNTHPTRTARSERPYQEVSQGNQVIVDDVAHIYTNDTTAQPPQPQSNHDETYRMYDIIANESAQLNHYHEVPHDIAEISQPRARPSAAQSDRVYDTVTNVQMSDELALYNTLDHSRSSRQCAITHPSQQGNTTHPSQQGDTTHPSQQGDTTHPSQQGNTTHPSQQGNTTHPSQQGDTTHPSQQGDTTHPSQQGDTTHPSQQGDTTHPSQQGDTTHPSQQGDTTHPTQQGDTTHPSQQGDTTHPTQQGDTTHPPQQGDTTHPPQQGEADVDSSEQEVPYDTLQYTMRNRTSQEDTHTPVDTQGLYHTPQATPQALYSTLDVTDSFQHRIVNGYKYTVVTKKPKTTTEDAITTPENTTEKTAPQDTSEPCDTELNDAEYSAVTRMQLAPQNSVQEDPN